VSDHPGSSPADPHAYRATVMAVRNLAGRQTLTLNRAWEILLQPEGGPDTIPDDAREPTRELLQEFGYREYLVTPVGGQGSRTLWIREDWPVETVEEVPFA
jgi:hypothetical protein